MTDAQHVEIRDVTPELAQQWLDTIAYDQAGGHRVQRRLRPRKVGEFADAMRRNEWTFNYDSVVFSVDPSRFGDDEQHLVDGQHRLAAIVESGIAQRMVVGWGAPPHVEETIDTGTKRTLGDFLTMRGEVDANNLAAAIRWVYRYLGRGDFRPDPHSETVQQIIAFFNRHPGIRESVSAAKNADVAIYGVPRSMIAAMHYLLGMIDAEDRDVFFETTASGVGLEEDDPRWRLREWCMRSVTTARKRPRTWFIGAVMIKAWNAWREGRRIELLGFKTGGANPEAFPALDGLDDQLVEAA